MQCCLVPPLPIYLHPSFHTHKSNDDGFTGLKDFLVATANGIKRGGAVDGGGSGLNN